MWTALLSVQKNTFTLSWGKPLKSVTSFNDTSTFKTRVGDVFYLLSKVTGSGPLEQSLVLGVWYHQIQKQRD